RRDDGGFVPRGHEDGDEPGVVVEHPVARICPAVEAIDRSRAPHAPREIDQVDEEVVDAKQQEAGARKQRQLGRGAAENRGNGHVKRASKGGAATRFESLVGSKQASPEGESRRTERRET